MAKGCDGCEAIVVGGVVGRYLIGSIFGGVDVKVNQNTSLLHE
jgi:hypothetical protein